MFAVRTVVSLCQVGTPVLCAMSHVIVRTEVDSFIHSFIRKAIENRVSWWLLLCRFVSYPSISGSPWIFLESTDVCAGGGCNEELYMPVEKPCPKHWKEFC